MRTFFISDTHFNHKNILKYEPCRVVATAEYMLSVGESAETVDEIKRHVMRAFAEEDSNYISYILKWHDKMLIHNWRETVSEQDTVWFLGDFGFGSKEYLKEIFDRLPGNKYFILGNHDRRGLSAIPAYYEMGWKYVATAARPKKWFMLTHEPDEYITDDYPLYNIYGHVHGDDRYPTETAYSRCVCVERTGFKPIELEIFDNFKESE